MLNNISSSFSTYRIKK